MLACHRKSVKPFPRVTQTSEYSFNFYPFFPPGFGKFSWQNSVEPHYAAWLFRLPVTAQFVERRFLPIAVAPTSRRCPRLTSPDGRFLRCTLLTRDASRGSFLVPRAGLRPEAIHRSVKGNLPAFFTFPEEGACHDVPFFSIPFYRFQFKTGEDDPPIPSRSPPLCI